MMINISRLISLYQSLMDEYQFQKSLGKPSSQIRTRIDCVLKGLHESIGTAVPGSSDDFIIEVDYDKCR